MMAWEYSVPPLSTMYETYFLNCSVTYFTEFVITITVIWGWHTIGSGTTVQSLAAIITGFAKSRWRQDKDQLNKSAFKLQALCHLHPFVHSQREIQAHRSSLPNAHMKSQVGKELWCVLARTLCKWLKILECAVTLIYTLCISSLILRLPKVSCLVSGRKNQQSTQPPT